VTGLIESMRPLPSGFTAYGWAPSTEELADRVGLDPFQMIRFDGNTAALPLPSSRPGTVAGALAEVNTYPHGGYPELCAAIADYAGVRPNNVVLGAGGDDLILLCARAFLGPGDRAAIASQPTYPLYRIATHLAGAEVSDSSPRVTFACRPNNPSGALDPLPDARPLVVDEAYFEYAGETAAGLLDTGVIVLRTFSKAFGLAGARVGYALADTETAAELNRRQSPLAVSTLSAALALAALRSPPDVAPLVAERERLAARVRSLGLEPWPSSANFIFVPMPEPDRIADRLLADGIVVRVFPNGVRISVRDVEDDDLLLGSLARALDVPVPGNERASRSTRHLRATAETCIRVRLSLDGQSRVRVATGAGIYDHLLEQLAFHAGLDLVLEGTGDLETGSHHTAEDSALALGAALDTALGDRHGIARYGDAVVPMDDARARASIDLGGRPWCECELALDPGHAGHVLQSLAQTGRLGLHVESSGRDAHHVAEAAFKAVGRALRAAVRSEGAGLPSTKGRL
jgi:histidinol-phosphate/aromatic aminotransferase/cobyric acid decarboxylase-like protein/imidazoleglycerol phosphate dehydratase HisB